MVATISMLVKEKHKPKSEKGCMEVENATLAFATIKCIITGLISTFCIMAMFSNIWETDSELKYEVFLTGGAGLTGCLSAFVFSIILAKGVMDRKHSYVKIYFVYGVLVLVLVSVAAIFFIFFLPDLLEVDNITTAIIASTILAYALILEMVRATYKKFKEESDYQRVMLKEERY